MMNFAVESMRRIDLANASMRVKAQLDQVSGNIALFQGQAGQRMNDVIVTAGESVNKVLARMQTQFSQGHFQVTTRVTPDLPRVLADEGAAEQAIENLLANAIKYSGEARTIEVEARRDHGHIVVSVTDHGIGIARREQGRIFRKFYRVQRELGGGPQGTGLGLAIVDHTMRGHGGFVRVESEPERGSTFSLHFPIPSENAFQGTLAESTR